MTSAELDKLKSLIKDKYDLQQIYFEDFGDYVGIVSGIFAIKITKEDFDRILTKLYTFLKPSKTGKYKNFEPFDGDVWEVIAKIARQHGDCRPLTNTNFVYNNKIAVYSGPDFIQLFDKRLTFLFTSKWSYKVVSPGSNQPAFIIDRSNDDMLMGVVMPVNVNSNGVLKLLNHLSTII